MSGDMSNAEFGVSEVDAVGAKGRLSGNRLDEQHSWSQNTMNERTLGYLFGLCIVILGVIWAVDISNVIRYLVTATIILVTAFWIFRILRSKSQLKEFQSNQAKKYANKS